MALLSARTPSAREALLAELRLNPFRPIDVADLRLIDAQKTSGTPILQAITREGYREIYRHTFLFTVSGDRLHVAITEVGFDLSDSGKVTINSGFLAQRTALMKLMDAGLGDIFVSFRQRKEEIRERAAADDLFIGPPLFTSRENIMIEGMYELLSPEERIALLNVTSPQDLAALVVRTGFDFFGSVPYYQRTYIPDDEPFALHTHPVENFDSNHWKHWVQDATSKVIWAIIDVKEINRILATDMPIQDKIKAIIDHHVDSIKNAICIGHYETSAIVRA